MKKGTLLLLLASVLFLNSCDDKDTTDFEQKNNLAGQWIPVKIGSLNAQNVVRYTDYQNDAACDVDNIFFNQDSTYVQNDYSDNAGTCENDSETGTYAVQGNTIVLTYIDETQTPSVIERALTVTNLNYNTMEVVYTDSVTHNLVFITLNKVQ
jgi:hypothetical protein